MDAIDIVFREKKVKFGIYVKFAIDWTVSKSICSRKIPKKSLKTVFEKILNFVEKSAFFGAVKKRSRKIKNKKRRTSVNLIKRTS